MSKISTVQQAYEALCAGEYFQVGEKIIDPSDIVRFEYGEEPIFHLQDGSTAQHERFSQGSVGDLLADALSVATRGEQQAQVLKPDFNIVVVGKTAYDRQGNILTQASNMRSRHAPIAPSYGTEGAYCYVDGNDDVVMREFGGSKTVITAAYSGYSTFNTPFVQVDDANRKIRYGGYDAANWHIFEVNYDGTNDTELKMWDADQTSGGDEVKWDPDAGYMFWRSSSGVFARYDVGTDSKVTLTNLSNDEGLDFLVLNPDQKEFMFEIQRSTERTEQFVYDYQGNQVASRQGSGEYSATNEIRYAAYYNEELFDYGPGDYEIHRRKWDYTLLDTLFTPSTSTEEYLDIGLVLSRL